jgi:DNA invertase Pin-like site-specific DNA recombinase
MQMRELRAFAKKRKFRVAGEYVDKISGAARTRPELDRMLADVRARKVDVVLVPK